MTTGAWLQQDGEHSRRYVTEEPMEVRHSLFYDSATDTTTEWSEPTTINEFIVEIPPRFENTINVPETWASDPNSGGYAIWTSPDRTLTFDDVLAALGVHLLPGPPPVQVDPEIPAVVGAVPSKPDLPSVTPYLGIYLTRDDHDANCKVDGEWQTMPWSDLAEHYGMTEAQVPDLTVG